MSILTYHHFRTTLMHVLLASFVLFSSAFIPFSDRLFSANFLRINYAAAEEAPSQVDTPAAANGEEQPLEEQPSNEVLETIKDKHISERQASDKTPLPDHTSFRISALPSYQNIPDERRVEYEFAVAHGLCAPVLEMERQGLLTSRPEFGKRFGRGVVVDPVDQAALHLYALGYRRCLALRDLAKGLAIARLKGGESHFASFAPKPRLGDFINEGRQDLKQLIIDRQDARGLDRPIDWAEEPLSIEDEVKLHHAFTELAVLAVCHAVPLAFEDLGRLHDKGFTPIDPFLIYGLFHQAIWLKIEPSRMRQRLKLMDDLLQADQHEELDKLAAVGILHKHPRLALLFGLCPDY